MNWARVGLRERPAWNAIGISRLLYWASDPTLGPLGVMNREIIRRRRAGGNRT